VNNADFYEALKKHRTACQAARDSDKPLPQVPNYLGECLLQIATNLARRPNFSGYAYREDMIMDGVENALRYIESFDPNRTKNPFGYFTKVIWFRFIRKIKDEKKQLYVRFKNSQSLLSGQGTFEAGQEEVQMNLSNSVDYMNAFIEEFEEKNFGKKNIKASDLDREAEEAKKNE